MVAVLALAYGLRERLIAPLVLRQVSARLRAELGADLSVARVSGDWVRELVLEGVRWRSPRPPLLRVDEGRVELRYSLRELVRGEKGWLHSVKVRGRGVALSAGERAESTGSSAALELPALELDLAAVELSGLAPWTVHLDEVRAKASLTAEELAVDELEARAGANHALVRAARVPLHPAGVTDLVRAASGQLSLALPEARTLIAADARPWPLVSADLSLALSQGRVSLGGRFDLVGGSLAVERGELALPDEGSIADANLDVALQADFADLGPLGTLVERELAGRWIGDVEVSGPLRAPTGHFVGRGEALEIAGVLIDGVQLDATTDGHRVRLESCIAHGAGLELTAEGQLGLEPLEMADVAVQFRASAPALLERLPFDCREVSGRALVSGPPRAPYGTFELALDGAALRGVELSKAEARGRVEGTTLVVERLALASEEARLSAALRLALEDEQLSAEVTELELDWRGTHAELAKPARLVHSTGRFAVDELELDTGAGRAAFTGEMNEGSKRARLELEQLDLSELVSAFLPPGLEVGVITGHVEGSLAGEELALGATLEVEGLRTHADGPEWRLDVDGRMAAGELDVGRFVARAETGEYLEGRLSMPFDPRQPRALLPGDVRLVLSAEVEDLAALPATLGGRLIASGKGRAKAELDLAGTWSSLTGSAHVSSAEVLLPGDGAALGPCRVDVDLEASPDSVLVKQGELVFAQGSLHAEGRLDAALDVAGLLASPPRLPRSASVQARVAFELPDVAGLAELSREVRRVAGRVSGELDVAGPLDAPQLHGRLTWLDGELRLTSDFPPLTHLRAELDFDGRRLTVASLSAEFGGAPVSLGGTVDLEGTQPRFDLRLKGQDLLLARSKRLRLRADADLALGGTLARPRISGEVIVTEGRFTGDIDLVQKLLHAGRAAAGSVGLIGPTGPLVKGSGRVSFWREPPLALAELDVRVRGRRFDVDTNFLKASLRPDVQLLGTGAVPTAEGPVYVDSATLDLPSGKLELVSGVLQFRQTDPFRPEAALSATARIQGYDVRAAITGALAGGELEDVQLSSSPPLAEDDLWVLVLTGQPPLDRWRDQNTQAMESVALFLAKDRVARWLAGDDTDTASLLERIEVEIGAQPSYTGQTTGRARLYLKKRAPTGRATYLSGEIDVYDRVNFGLGLMFRPR